jgi:FMN phosphatase YigB (HAD superfamily)
MVQAVPCRSLKRTSVDVSTKAYSLTHTHTQAYPEAVEAVRRLHESGAKLIVLSNSSRRTRLANRRSFSVSVASRTRFVRLFATSAL